MNGWAIAFIIYYAVSFALSLNRWASGGGWIKVGPGDIFLGPFITLFLLYMSGFFNLT
jgi:hypothetical protein